MSSQLLREISEKKLQKDQRSVSSTLLGRSDAEIAAELGRKLDAVDFGSLPALS